MKNKTYNFETISQMLDVVNDDNIQVLGEDFFKFLIFYNNSIKAVRKELPKETEGKTNLQILSAEFVWRDDDFSQLTEVKLINKGSGLVESVKVNMNN